MDGYARKIYNALRQILFPAMPMAQEEKEAVSGIRAMTVSS
jgi:hypothetical protein